MNCIVCVKQVPDTEARIKIAADQRGIEESDVKLVLNPFDEYAVEEALRLREADGNGTVTVISLGDERAAQALRTCLAMGADSAILLKDPAFDGADSLGRARILAAAIKDLDYQLILLGKMGMGDDLGQLGPMLAELLDLPHVGVVVKLELAEGRVIAQRQVESAVEEVEAPLPVLITAEKGLNEPRYASLKGIMMAKRKPIEEMNCAALGLDPATVGAAGAHLVQTKLEFPPPRPAGRIIDGEPPEAAAELLRLLREEAKVI